MWRLIDKYPFRLAIVFLVIVGAGTYAGYHNYRAIVGYIAGEPFILTHENTKVVVEPTTNGDGGACARFEPKRMPREIHRHPATYDSALRLVEAEVGHPVEKLLMSIMGDGCPDLSQYRVVFSDPEVDPDFTRLLQARRRTAPR